MMRFGSTAVASVALASAEVDSSLPPFSLATASAFASIAEASYCGPMMNLTAWTCDPCVESGVSVQPGSVSTVSAGGTSDNAEFAYVARLGGKAGPGPLENGCVVSFRGSEDLTNWIKDIEVTYDSMSDVCDSCKAEHGFHSVWHQLDTEIISDLSDIGCVPGGDPIFITGHSLGAAVATVATLELFSKGFNIGASYLFESPRVGNSAFAAYFDSQFNGKDVWRITNGADPVPDTPAGFDYHHTGQEVFFDKNGDHHVCASYSECGQYKPTLRLNAGDHCALPLVPEDICTCRGWVQVIPSMAVVV